LDNIVYVTDTRVIADLSQKRENVSALGLIPYKNHVYAYEYNALYEVLIDKVEDPLTIDDNETVISGAYDDDNDALLFATKSGKIIQYSKGQFQFMDTDDGAFHKAAKVLAYNGRMYLLDNEAKQIWKYSKRRDRYGNAEEYIANGNFENAVDFAIDGFIYVLQADGSLIKYDRGNKVDFSIMKAPLDPIENPTSIYTELDLNKIFILEASKNRVIVFNKDIQSGNLVYDSQYIFDNLGDLRDIYFDKDGNKLYVLDAQKIYEVAL
jgi:DNA-binding beta-propeller fold protein YncE